MDMDAADQEYLNERDDHSAQTANSDYRADGMKEVREGQPMGGHKFNQEGSPTPMGDDKDNPSRNAGYTNGYFARTEPLTEDTANNNFKAAYQEGAPDYDAAQPNVPGPQEVPDQQKVGEDNDNGQEQQQQAYHEPELGDQQPDHGSNGTETGEEKDHIET